MELLYDKTALDRFLEAHREEMVGDILRLIRIPSISRDLHQVAAALRQVLDKAGQRGFQAVSLLDDRVGLVEMGSGPEVIGVLAHVDVVEAEGNWEIPPFAGRVKDGWIWGRGAVDDKGPLFAAFYAMQAVRSLRLPLCKKVQLIIGTQEEAAWTDMRAYVQNYQTPAYGFTPDGEFPVTNREKGYADIRLDFPKTRGQGGDFELMALSGGKMVNMIPAAAQAVIRGEPVMLENCLADYLEARPGAQIALEQGEGGLLVTASGVSAHSSVPEKGVNAIALLGDFLCRLPLGKGGAANLPAFLSACCHEDFYGKAIGLYGKSEYLNGEYIHRNVISPTLLETKADCFSVTLNLRTSPGTHREDIERAFAAFARQYGYSWEHLAYEAPVYVPKDRPFLKVLGDAYEEISGQAAEPALALGTSYAKAMPNIVAYGPVFPGEEDFCHAADERISIASLLKAAKIYARALAAMAFSQKSFK